MKTKKSMTKRGRRRLRGLLEQQQRVLVHYFMYYGVREYTPAALDYFKPDKRNYENQMFRWWKEIGNKRYPDYTIAPYEWNRHARKITVQFDTLDEAQAHIMERTLGMLEDDGQFYGYDLYAWVPYKISIVRGHKKRKKTLWSKNLGTKL